MVITKVSSLVDGRHKQTLNAFRNITRCDYGRTHGWWVRFQRLLEGKKKVHSKLFSDGVCGGRGKALKAAQAWRDEQERLVPARSYRALQIGLGRIRRARRKRADGSSYPVWAAWIMLKGGRLAAASYAVHVWGDVEAKKKVIAWYKRKRRELGLSPKMPTQA
jgi:hypothetical protein